MSVTVIVPWRDVGCPWRSRALDLVVDIWGRWGAPVVVAKDDGAGGWVKARPVRAAVARAPDGVVVVADADVVLDEPGGAIRVVAAWAAWAVPHGLVARLTPAATERCFGGGWPSVGYGLDEPLYQGVTGGGIVVARRDVLLDCPPDPRFEGWGGEDIAWGQALTCLYGQPWRGSGLLYHLWHPAQPRQSRSKGSAASQALAARYRQARASRTAMRQLVDETREA